MNNSNSFLNFMSNGGLLLIIIIIGGLAYIISKSIRSKKNALKLEQAKRCAQCGTELGQNGSRVCPNCGASATLSPSPAISEKSWLCALLLNIFLGGFGIHRFYVGKVGTGVLWLLTYGCFGIGVIVDLILICTDNFTDANGSIVLSDQKKAKLQGGSIGLNSNATQSESYVDQLEKISNLYKNGILSEEEFEIKKKQILYKIGQ